MARHTISFSVLCLCPGRWIIGDDLESRYLLDRVLALHEQLQIPDVAVIDAGLRRARVIACQPKRLALTLHPGNRDVLVLQKNGIPEVRSIRDARSVETCVILIRHAESLSNALRGKGGFGTEEANRLLRQYVSEESLPLTNRGEHQAREAGRALAMWIARRPELFSLDRGTPFDIEVRDSGYLRAARTREIFVEEICRVFEHISIVTRGDTRLRERKPGVGFLMTREDFLQKHPEQAYAYERDPYSTVPPGGESVESRERPMLAFLRSIRRGASPKLVLAFTHGGPMKAAARLAGRGKFAWPGPANCEAYVLHILGLGRAMRIHSLRSLRLG